MPRLQRPDFILLSLSLHFGTVCKAPVLCASRPQGSGVMASPADAWGRSVCVPPPAALPPGYLGSRGWQGAPEGHLGCGGAGEGQSSVCGPRPPSCRTTGNPLSCCWRHRSPVPFVNQAARE